VAGLVPAKLGDKRGGEVKNPPLKLRGGKACPPNKFFGRRGSYEVAAGFIPAL